MVEHFQFIVIKTNKVRTLANDTDTDYQMNESMVDEIKCSLPKARENACDRVVIDFISSF